MNPSTNNASTIANDGIVLGLLVFLTLMGSVVASPEGLGLPEVVVRWMAVSLPAVGLLLNRLQTVGQNPNAESK